MMQFGCALFLSGGVRDTGGLQPIE